VPLRHALPPERHRAKRGAVGMSHGQPSGGHHFETEEAREIRERYNMLHGGLLGAAAISNSIDNNHIALPCAAGVVWVDLSEFGDNSTSDDASPQPPVRSEQGGEADLFEQHEQAGSSSTSPGTGRRARFAWFGKEARNPSERNSVRRASPTSDSLIGLKRQQTVSFLGRRRQRQDSRDAPDRYGGAHGARASGLYEANEEEVALELLNFELKPQVGAEEAKAAATRSAQVRESAVELETQVRQMWRVVMGTAPGLKVRSSLSPVFFLRSACCERPSPAPPPGEGGWPWARAERSTHCGVTTTTAANTISDATTAPLSPARSPLLAPRPAPPPLRPSKRTFLTLTRAPLPSGLRRRSPNCTRPSERSSSCAITKSRNYAKNRTGRGATSWPPPMPKGRARAACRVGHCML
jgi:hypothetical protein